MTWHSLLRRIIVYTAVLAASIGTASAGKKAAPPTAKELGGVWVGFDDDELTFTRLDLRPNGTGYCARVSPPDTILHHYGVQLYRVAHWGINSWVFVIELTPISSNGEPVYLKGRYVLESLKLEIGSTDKWKMGLLLHPEIRIAAANEETKEAIRDADKGTRF